MSVGPNWLQHDDRLIIGRLDAVAKGAQGCRELSAECFGRAGVNLARDVHQSIPAEFFSSRIRGFRDTICIEQQDRRLVA